MIAVVAHSLKYFRNDIIIFFIFKSILISMALFQTGCIIFIVLNWHNISRLTGIYLHRRRLNQNRLNNIFEDGDKYEDYFWATIYFYYFHYLLSWRWNDSEIITSKFLQDLFVSDPPLKTRIWSLTGTRQASLIISSKKDWNLCWNIIISYH